MHIEIPMSAGGCGHATSITYPIDLVGPCHFADLEGHKASTMKARGLKNEFLHRFKTKLPLVKGIWFLLICRPMTEGIEILKK